jgi:hypothetical protein
MAARLESKAVLHTKTVGRGKAIYRRCAGIAAKFYFIMTFAATFPFEGAEGAPAALDGSPWKYTVFRMGDPGSAGRCRFLTAYESDATESRVASSSK